MRLFGWLYERLWDLRYSRLSPGEAIGRAVRRSAARRQSEERQRRVNALIDEALVGATRFPTAHRKVQVPKVITGSDYCWECDESRESMDPFDRYPDMGGWRSVPDLPWLRTEQGLISVWMCDGCMDEFDSTMEGCA
jgi:hypothetical protein